MSELFSADTLVARTKGVIESQVDGEVVALNIETGTCYGLNEIGSRIWHMLASPIRVDDICKVLLAEYQVEPEECMRDVIDLIAELRADNLVVVTNDT